MSLRYQKRVKTGKGWGLNLSRSGVSTSYRSRHGSVGSRGFSIRTGIPGLSYRHSWGKSGNGPAILLAYVLIAGGLLVMYNLVRLIIYLIKRVYEAILHKIQHKRFG